MAVKKASNLVYKNKNHNCSYHVTLMGRARTLSIINESNLSQNAIPYLSKYFIVLSDEVQSDLAQNFRTSLLLYC